MSYLIPSVSSSSPYSNSQIFIENSYADVALFALQIPRCPFTEVILPCRSIQDVARFGSGDG